MRRAGPGWRGVSSRAWYVFCVGQLALSIGCSRLNDGVFEAVILELSAAPLSVPENVGVAHVPITLTRPASSQIVVNYHVLELSAQSGCQTPDFDAAEGTLVWPAGESVANLDLWIENDLLAETDERLKLVFEDANGSPLLGSSELELTIIDDDRTDLIDARASFGVEPNSAADQSRALQRALDAAHQSGRGVVLLAAGDYEITSLILYPGTTLSGRGAHLHRPPRSPVDTTTILVEHAGMSDSLPALVENLSIDGRREEQGPYLGYERALAPLIAVRADPAMAGRALLSLEQLSLSSGTGDGVSVGTNADGQFCRLRGNDLWGDMLSARGGNARLRLRDLDASASLGKSGMYFDVDVRGFPNTRRLDVEIEDARMQSGDVEIAVTDGSRVSVQRLVMTDAPFRLEAPGSTVLVADSVITSGVRTPGTNYWGAFQDVQFKNTTLRVSENDDSGTAAVPTSTVEADRTLSAVQIEWPVPPPPPGRLSFENCRFEQASNLETTDTVYAIDSRVPGPTISVVNSVLGPNFRGWFAQPGCDCHVDP